MPIDVSTSNAVAVVTVDRQEAMNALDVSSVGELRDVLAGLAVDPAVRCVILTGAGERAFIGGADIKYMAQVDGEQAREFAALGHEAGRLLETMPKPTIAAINGYALGGGCEMALAWGEGLAEALTGPEAREGLAAFVEKRTPGFAQEV
jgi:enoyl-CoA hydratase